MVSIFLIQKTEQQIAKVKTIKQQQIRTTAENTIRAPFYIGN